MPLSRTPEERFVDLPGYGFTPHYLDIDGARMHYVDEGTGPVVLCLHGEPSWSYLYRKIIARLVPGHRVIAPDFIGFGRSDKYTDVAEYTFPLHRESLIRLIEALDLHGITLVVQDWGGLIGLRVAGMRPERFARLVVMNTGLPTGEQKMTEGFDKWRAFVAQTPDLPIGPIIQSAVVTRLPPEVVAAYDAPFPGPEYKAGAKAWPLMVPISPADPVAPEMTRARQDLQVWTKPVLVMFSDKDPVTKGGERWFRENIPGARGLPEITIKDAGHFLQEDKGEEIAKNIIEFIGGNG